MPHRWSNWHFPMTGSPNHINYVFLVECKLRVEQSEKFLFNMQSKCFNDKKLASQKAQASEFFVKSIEVQIYYYRNKRKRRVQKVAQFDLKNLYPQSKSILITANRFWQIQTILKTRAWHNSYKTDLQEKLSCKKGAKFKEKANISCTFWIPEHIVIASSWYWHISQDENSTSKIFF